MKPSIISKFLVPVVALTACACYATADGAILQPQRSASTKSPLVFRVSGQAQTWPENVTIRFAIIGDGDTLNEAEQQLKKTEQTIFTALEKQAIKRNDIELEGFTATPLQAGNNSSTTSFKPLGYRVQRQYQITMPVSADSLDKVIKVADAALAQGGRPVMLPSDGYDGYDRRQASLLEFIVKDPEKLTKEAMADALKRARKLAEQAAAEMGCPPSTLKLIAVHSSDAGASPYRDDYSEPRTPAKLYSWQPIKTTVSIEAEFDVK